MSKLSCEKFFCTETEFKAALFKVIEGHQQYCIQGFNLDGNVTRNQMSREFFERIAEFYGFQITWPKNDCVCEEINARNCPVHQ